LAKLDPVSFLNFRPPRLAPASAGSEATVWPHIRLDRALDYLIGDQLQ
jgi:predicted YcjX-like family ATPase